MGLLVPSLITLLVALAAVANGQQSKHKFAVNFYNAVASAAGLHKNIAISPYSAEAALSMVYVGAGGTTKSELAAALDIGSSPSSAASLAAKFQSIDAASSNYTLRSANAIFLEQSFPIEPAFRGVVTTDFSANITTVDFKGNAEAARRQINTFIEEKTNDKIKDAFSEGSLDPLTRLVLVNAVYFKADWAIQFDAADTENQRFSLSNGQTKPVKLMKKDGPFRYNYKKSTELGGAQILELPYTGDATSMFVILPKAEGGLEGLERVLTPASLDSALQGLRQKLVTVFLPRFKVNTGLDLKEPLQTLGVNAAFTSAANFSGISRNEDLEITKAVQKVFVEVNEKGTEASAATAVVVGGRSQPEMPVEFRADRPFLYLIRHRETNTILFLGRVSDPTVEN